MNENIKKLMEFIDKNRYVNYPIENKELIAGEDYVKNLYLKMLAVMMQQAGQTDEVCTAFFTRIVAGAQTEQTVQDYLRQALEIEVEDFRKFTEALQENPLKYRFVVDALLLTGIGSQSKEQQQLLVGLMEFLNIGKAEAAYLVQLSRSILMQDNAEYDKAEAGRPKTISFELFLEYTRLYAYVLSNDEEYIYISFPEKTEFVLPQAKLRAKKIYLNNLKITLQANASFEMADTIIIENCDFCGKRLEKEENKYSYIYMLDNGKISFCNCNFKDFGGDTIDERGNKEINLESCVFENCCKRTYNYRDSGVICSRYHEDKAWNSGVDKIYLQLKDCVFRNCSTNNYNGDKRYNPDVSKYVISNVGVKAENCIFSDCRNQYRDSDGHWKEASTWRFGLFPKGSVDINNTINTDVRFIEG